MHQNNVISFPKEYKGPIDLQKITENLEMVKQYHIQETISNIAPMLFTQLDLAGFSSFDDGSENSLKEGAFVIEAIRAILCRHYEIYHPFQDLSDKIFTLETDDVSELKVVDSLNIKFRKMDESE